MKGSLTGPSGCCPRMERHVLQGGGETVGELPGAGGRERSADSGPRQGVPAEGTASVLQGGLCSLWSSVQPASEEPEPEEVRLQTRRARAGAGLWALSFGEGCTRLSQNASCAHLFQKLPWAWGGDCP